MYNAVAKTGRILHTLEFPDGWNGLYAISNPSYTMFVIQPTYQTANIYKYMYIDMYM